VAATLGEAPTKPPCDARRLERGIARTECARRVDLTPRKRPWPTRSTAMPARVLPNSFRTARLMIISIPLQRSVSCQLCSRQIPRKFHSRNPSETKGCGQIMAKAAEVNRGRRGCLVSPSMREARLTAGPITVKSSRSADPTLP
jgi:hypothetical protein